MLMSAIDRAVDAVPLVVGLLTKCFEHTLPDTLACPAVEAIEHGLPGAKVAGKISPRSTCTPPPQYRLNGKPALLSAQTGRLALRAQCASPEGLGAARGPGPRHKPRPTKQTGPTTLHGPSGTGTGTFTAVDTAQVSRFTASLETRLEAGLVAVESLHASVEDEPARLTVALDVPAEPSNSPKRFADRWLGGERARPQRA